MESRSGNVVHSEQTVDINRLRDRERRRLAERERRRRMTDEQIAQRRERDRLSYHRRVQNRINAEERLQRERLERSWQAPPITHSHEPTSNSLEIPLRLTHIRRQARNAQIPNSNPTNILNPNRLTHIRRQARRIDTQSRQTDDPNHLPHQNNVTRRRLRHVRQEARTRHQLSHTLTHSHHSEGPNIDAAIDGTQELGLPMDDMPPEYAQNAMDPNGSFDGISSDSDGLPFQDENDDHEDTYVDDNDLLPNEFAQVPQNDTDDDDITLNQPNIPTNTTNSNRRRYSRRRQNHNCARNYVDSPNLQPFRLPNPKICLYCGAKRFHHEAVGFCCSNGKVKVPQIRAPAELIQLYTAQTPEGVHFRQHIRVYNHNFSFTSMGVHLDDRFANNREGVYTYRALGSIYHRIGSLMPEAGHRPRFLQLYIYDTARELENRIAENNHLNRQVLSILQRVMDTHNPYVRAFHRVSQRIDVENIELILKDHPTEAHQYNMPTSSEVAAIVIGGEDPADVNERDIVVQRLSGELESVPDTASYYDPLQYPLLFPYGSSGWDLYQYRTDGSRMSCRDFYCYLLQIRPNEPMLFLRGGRLLQQFVVDNYVKISTQRLRYIRDNQQHIRAELYQGLQDSFNNGEVETGNVGRRTILPPSYVGSPRDMHRRYHDAMAIVQKYGKPDLFITMTCNGSWEEITNELEPGEVASDRPDLTTRIFHSKCEELKNDLFHKGVLGKVVAHVHVIEFQKRGLPHAHILLILHESDKLRSPEDYDKVVRAEIPDPNIEPDLYQVVIKHMIHGPCGTMNPRNVCMNEKGCKKNFPKKFAPVTLQGEDSFPVYQRRENGAFAMISNHGRSFRVDNRWVVPYNPWLLKKYNCHINVEICSSIQSVKYLYKYVYKGSDRVGVEVRGRNQEGQDEIKKFVDGRWICPQEAFWRIYGFPLNRMYPSVYALQIHLENLHEVSFPSDQLIEDILNDERNSRSMLTEFFRMNLMDEQSRQYLYREFPEHYTWDKSAKRWNTRVGHNRVIGRLYAVSPSEGEKFYLRLLLNHVRGPTSFQDLKTVGTEEYSTFREAAEARGLLERDDSIRSCLLEASSVQMPAALRSLFVIILTCSNPAGVRDLWNEFHPYMSQDYGSSSSNSTYLTDRLLHDLNILLQQHGKNISHYDLPSITSDFSDYGDGDALVHEERRIPITNDDLSAISSLNTDQKFAFQKIVESVMKKESALYFVDGPGGTGKTFLYKAVLAKLRNEGLIAIATATSGIAAIMMPGGRTAHSRFKIPVPIASTSTCRITKNSELGILLKQARILIWDEATMAHRYCFEALDRTLQDICDNNAPFGGKVFVMGGDFRQTLPVVRNGSRGQTIAACITNSPLWSNVETIRLTENMRAANDPTFANLLLRVGDGDEESIEDDMIRLPDEVVIPWENENSRTSLINEIFPNLHQYGQQKEYMIQRAIIAPTNDSVDLLNKEIISVFPGEEVTLYSFDSVDNDSRNLYQQDYLNSISTSSLPPHELKLKVGAPVILTRNLDPKIGLCNGTRLICRDFYPNVIDAEIVTGSCIGTRVFLPRLPLRSSEDTRLPFILTRKQYPIKLSFALTINKSQGQTIPQVGIYLPNNVFSHGQLYVALSRGTSQSTTRVLVQNGKINGVPGVFTKNVVYRDVLNSCNPQPQNQ